MEAVPRLPMINFELKTSTEKVTFGTRIKPYIASFYHEDPESYNEQVHNLDALRGIATRPAIDVNGCQLLKKYYCQLHFLKSRFPMEEGQPCATTFFWKDSHSNMICSVPDIDFEISCILYNIGALHSQLGAVDSRTNPDGMKMACTHFQCAVWAFQTLRENYSRMVACLLPPEMMNFMKQICLAQAQECILEKSMLDNRKATIIAKVAVQVVDYYKKSLNILSNNTEDGSFADILGTKPYKKWHQYILFKISYHKCISLLYQGQQAEEQQKMGERVAFYQNACECLEEARKLSSSLPNKEQIDEALAFTLDVVEGKRKAAKNENEFIYHEDVPEKSSLQEVKGASLVKGIPFNINDSEVSGADIFAKLVPMEAHEASSLYSEHKAQMLRRIGEIIERKDQALAEFLSSLQLDYLTQIQNATGLTQDIVDRAAAMSAQPNAVADLLSSMTKLSDMYNDVENMLREIQELLKEEEENEKNYQSLVGKRAPSIIATDLSREFQKYMEAHNKASESNQNLNKAMTTHVNNLKVLSMPLQELQQQIPAVELSNSNVDVESMDQLDKLVNKIDEMKAQRATLWNDLRTSVHNDDITGVLVTKEANQSLDDLFQKELGKHKHLCDLIEQNALAQENILKAMVNVYAEFSESRKYIQEMLNKRKVTMAALIASYDTYDDLLSKAQKGLEFYNKLETNVTKLLQRVKGATNVQQEERDQILKKNKMDTPAAVTTTATRTPKLKDYLDSRKYKESSDVPQLPSNYGRMNADAWPPAVRPAPLGSEITTQETYSPSTYGTVQSNADTLAKRMAALMSKDKTAYGDIPSAQQYNVNQNYNTYSYPSTNINTYSTNSYQTISSVSNPGGYVYDQATVKANISSNNEYNQSNAGYYHQQTYLSTEQTQPYASNVDSGHKSNTTNQNQQQSYMNPQSSTYANVPMKPEASSYQHYYYDANTQNYSVQPSTVPTTAANNLYSTPQTIPYSNYLSSTQNPSLYQAGVYGNEPKATSYDQFSGHKSYYTDSNASTYMPATNTTGTYSNTQVSYTQSYGSPQISYMSQNPYANPQAAYGNTDTQLANSQTVNTNQSVNVNPQTYYGNLQTSNVNPQTSQVNTDTSVTSNMQSYNTQQNFYGENQYYGRKETYNQNPYGAGTSYANNQTSLTNVQTSFTNTQTSFTNAQTSYSQANTDPSPYSNNQTVYGTTQTQYGNRDAYGNIYGVQTPYASNTQAYYQDPNYNYGNVPGYQNVNNSMYNYAVSQQAPFTTATTTTTTTPSVEPPKKSSNVDLLAGLDFTISQMPLTPQAPSTTESKDISSVAQSQPSTSKTVTKVVEEKHDSIENVKYLRPKKDPFSNVDVLKQFANEIDRIEKFVNGLTNKTANGQTTLELKWKFIQDSQDNDKRAISVARCYPLKNRFPDILPYDYSRVELKTTKDDYINATYLKDITNTSPPFVITQNPLQCTFDDFWSMVWEQQTENIICIMNDNELVDDIYWPNSIGKNITFPNKIVSLQNAIVKEYWTERIFVINILETRESRTVNHYQFTAWPTSILPVCPGPFVQFAHHIWISIEQQKCLAAPLIVHCSSGIGRSGLFCLLLTLINDVARFDVNLPDVTNLIVKMSNIRKNVLRDRSHFKFAYDAFLYYLKYIYKRYEDPVKEDKEKDVKVVDDDINVDPLNSLDPLWATKRNQ